MVLLVVELRFENGLSSFENSIIKELDGLIDIQPRAIGRQLAIISIFDFPAFSVHISQWTLNARHTGFTD